MVVEEGSVDSTENFCCSVHDCCTHSKVHVKVKVTRTWYTAMSGSESLIRGGLQLLTSSPGTHPNPPSLGVSITWCEPSPHGDEIRCLLYIPYRASAILSSHIGLVPILHLGMVRLWLTETLPNVATLCLESTQLTCIAALDANCYTAGLTDGVWYYSKCQIICPVAK